MKPHNASTRLLSHLEGLMELLHRAPPETLPPLYSTEKSADPITCVKFPPRLQLTW